MTLVLEVEYLSGVSFAAIGPESEIPDWPPQPDRVYSALVASWAARGENDEEREALEWLERLDPPSVIASAADARTAAVVFVPPNDPRSDKQKHALGVLPALRSRQPRRFPAACPRDPVVRFLWSATDADSRVGVLQRIAHDTAYVGHSASLTRCRFFIDDRHDDTSAVPPERRVYRGRLDELQRAFRSGRRPLKGDPIRKPKDTGPSRIRSVFADRWLLLEHIGGVMPDIRASALVARGIRDTLMSGYQRAGHADSIPEEVSGHSADGKPSQSPHAAIVPLAFTGFRFADGRVLGFAVVPKGDAAILDQAGFRSAIRSVAPIDEERGRRVMTVRTKEGTTRDAAFSVEFSPSYEAARRSLDPSLYLGPAHTFATITPIVLPRHLKTKGEERLHEIEMQIADACAHVGLPAPAEVVVAKHSAFEGAVSARPSGNAPAWTSWRLPAPLASRQLVHAVIRFEEAIYGPVILGAGRYVGLGLCRPIGDRG